MPLTPCTVTLAVAGALPPDVLPLVVVPLPPPQLILDTRRHRSTTPSAALHVIRLRRMSSGREFLRRRTSPNNTAKLNARIAGKGPKSPNFGRLRKVELLAWVVTVSVVVPLPVTEAGLIAHVVPERVEGTLHVKFTAPAKPLIGVSLRVAVPELPALSVRVPGETES